MPDQEEQAKILIVDDEEVNIDVLVSLLKPNYRIVIAMNGEQAFKRLKKYPLPDLVLLDVIMPGLDGYEICRRIKNNPETKDIPVIFITGKIKVEDEAKGFQVGAVDYIAKPFSPLVVSARVKTHVELKQRGDLLEKLASLDGLTRIPNRRRLDQFLDSEWKRSIRRRHDISLLLIDIDYFKLYNDHYGHMEGDECLKKIAGAISRAMPRSEDLTARYGGEEFACILPETKEPGARTVANRILDEVRALQIPHTRSKAADRVTVSIGVATMVPIKADLPLNLLEMADKALYKAKNNGRNQIVSLGNQK